MTVSVVGLDNNYDGALRAARLEVTPLVPDLAPGLAENPLIIHDALWNAVEQRGKADPSNIPEVGWNKAERHTTASFLIQQQVRHIVIGEDRNARFINVPSRMPCRVVNTLKGPAKFEPHLGRILLHGKRLVEHEFTTGDDLSHQWWPLAHERYGSLGERMLELVPPGELTQEALNLDDALRGVALGQTTIELVKFVRRNRARLPMGRPNHIAAAHDLSYLMLSQAGVHGGDIPKRTALNLLEASVERSVRTNCYIARPPRNEETNDNRNEVFPRSGHESPTLKCPAHTMSALKTLVHASINMAAGYKLFN